MRRLVIVSSFLLASVRIAASQPAGAPTPPPEGDKQAEPAKTEPAKGEDKKAPPEKEENEEKEEAEGGEGQAEPPPEETQPEPKVVVGATYDNGLKFESSDKNYAMKLQWRNQLRFESLRPTETNSQFLNKFYIVRARFQAEGHVFGDENRYKAEVGLGDAGSFSFLKDIYIDRKLSDAPVFLRMGQWKRPFFRQQLVSDFAGQFNERSIVDELAGGGRDLGVAMHNDYEKTAEGIEWAVGMFNGFSGGSERPTISSTCVTSPTGSTTCINGRPTTFANDFGPTIVARAGWNSARAKGYSEGDLEGGPLRYSIGAAYKVDLANFAKHGQPSLAQNLSHGLELDWNIKNNGISFSGGAVLMKIKSADADFGFMIQPGLMLVPKHMEVAARFGLTTEHRTDAMGMTTTRDNIEALGAVNYYWHGHRMKLASDFGILKKTGEDPITKMSDKPDIRVRVMMQLEI